jgi:hypothetical protein
MTAPEPHTTAYRAFERNLQGIMHMLKLSHHEMVMVRAQAERLATGLKKGPDLATKPARAKLVRSLKRFTKTLNTRIDRFHTLKLWQIVMLVTCVEAYLQDVLTAAAKVDPELMSRSEQRARYVDVIAATSLDALANELRARWARGRISYGGPTRWISRLEKMGARGYSTNLGPRLERFWGIRHCVVHAAGVVTSDFVKRYPEILATVGDRLRANNRDLQRLVSDIGDFIRATERFFLSRYPSMVAAV